MAKQIKSNGQHARRLPNNKREAFGRFVKKVESLRGTVSLQNEMTICQKLEQGGIALMEALNSDGIPKYYFIPRITAEFHVRWKDEITQMARRAVGASSTGQRHMRQMSGQAIRPMTGSGGRGSIR